jgi:lipopolysaccharide transport system ATP-binding protein
LIIDEALAVGDQHFQKKCVERIEHFRNQGCTILFCSHSLYHVRQLCDQVLWLDQGRMKAWGPMDEVISAYETHVRLQDAQTQSNTTATKQGTLVKGAPALDMNQQGGAADGPQALTALPNGRAAITQAWVQGLETAERPVQRSSNMRITLQASTPGVDAPSMGFMLEQFKGVGIMSLATHAEGIKPVAIRQVAGHTEWSVSLTLTDLPLHSGTYALSFYLFDAQGLVVYDEWKDHIVFDWISPSLTPGLVRLPHVWT